LKKVIAMYQQYNHCNSEYDHGFGFKFAY